MSRTAPDRRRPSSDTKWARRDAQRRTKSKRSTPRSAWVKRPAVWIGALITAVATTLATNYSQQIVNRPPRTGDPVKRLSVAVKPAAGDSWVFPRPITLSTAQIQSATGWRDQNTPYSPDHFHAWATAHGGMPTGGMEINLVVAGNRNDAVRILDMRIVDKHCFTPYTGTLFYSPGGGADSTVALNFDLDKADPDPVILGSKGDNYFNAKTISLKYGEQQVFRILADTSRFACTFRLRLTVLDGSRTVYQTINDGSRPFAMSAMFDPQIRDDGYSFSPYKKVYAGGPASPLCDASYREIDPIRYTKPC